MMVVDPHPDNTYESVGPAAVPGAPRTVVSGPVHIKESK
jgi:hypothetical protein